MKTNKRLERLFNSHKLIKCERQPKNLKTLLTSAKINEDKTVGAKKCHKPRCTLCDIIIEGPSFHFENNDQFIIRRRLTCDSKYTIYALKCDGCPLTYIGISMDLRLRINKHKSDINVKDNRILYATQHFFMCSGKFSFMPLYQNENYSALLQYEQYFIEKFKPSLNKTFTAAQK